MEHIYTAYTKQIDNQTHYFVKKYLAFPEYKNVDPILESYGMHTDFSKACSIADIFQENIREQLLNEMNGLQQAKIIDLGAVNFPAKTVAF